MTANWNLSSFGFYMNSLLKRYFAQENLVSSGAVELRAAWRTPSFVYAVFTVMSTRGLAYVGLEMDPIPASGNVTSEEDTAVKGWVDQLAGSPFAGDLDYGAEDRIQWLGKGSDNVPQHFSELRRMGTEVFLPLTGHG